MPTDRAQSRVRGQSLSSGDESLHPRPHPHPPPHPPPHPVKVDSLRTPDSRKRARLLRSKSTSNVSDAISRPPDATDHEPSKLPLKQVDIVTLRKLAGLPETAEPLRDRHNGHDDRLGISCFGDHEGSSPQSLRRDKQMKSQKHSGQSHHSENALPSTTSEGRRYVATSTPAPENSIDNGPRFPLQDSVYSPHSPSAFDLGGWPEKRSSKVASFKNSPRSATHHVDEDRPSRGLDAKSSRARTHLNKSSTDYLPLLRATLNSDSADEGSERDTGASLKMLNSQRVPTLEQPKTWPLPMAAVHGEETDLSDDYQRTTPGSSMRNRPTSNVSRPGSRSSTESTVSQLGELRTSKQNPVTSCQVDQGMKGQYRSAGLSYKESVHRSRYGGDDYQRESLASQITATIDGCQQSIFTRSSSRSSLASDTSIQSTSTTTHDTSSSVRRLPRKTNQGNPATEQYTNGKVDEMEPKVSTYCKDEASLAETHGLDFARKHEESSRLTLRLSTMSNASTETNTHPKSISSWRQARRAKVREYKMRDLDASRAEVANSPVSGSVPSSVSRQSRAHSSVTQEAPTPIKSSRFSSMPGMMTTTTSDVSKKPHKTTDVDTPGDSQHEHSSREAGGNRQTTRGASRTSDIQLNISPIIATEIEPVYASIPRWQTSGMTISPVMVVVDVESRPGPSTLRTSTRARPETIMPPIIPRTMIRPKPLKISLQPRQRPLTVTMSRNPLTGEIERNTVGPVDSKLHRRSLINMPTPPLSPEATRASKRLSLPPADWHFPSALRSRASRLERHSFYAEELEPELEPEAEPEAESESGAEPEAGNRLRNTTLKERVMREKLQKEKEIMDIVAKTVGPPQERTVYDGDDDEPDLLPLEQNNAETLEKRLRRLERNKDAWLCAMKPLLETMARTLDDVREDDKGGSLKMSDFIIDMEAEGRQVTHSRREDGDSIATLMQHADEFEPNGMQIGVIPEHSNPEPPSPVSPEPDSSSFLDDRGTSMNAMSQGLDGNEAALSTSHATAISSNVLAEKELVSYKAVRRPMRQQETTTDNVSNGRAMASESLRDKFPISLEIAATLVAAETPAANIGVAGAAESESLAEVEESSDWSDVDPLIWELGNMPHKPKESGVRIQETTDGNVAASELSPIMRELMSASRLWSEEAGNGH
ncbi:hypothetical protein GGR50DRAFT_682096 [Xylaria sp. CBS 124048]|nr:hypothetical protein GGR50DRAFT_682096 [Xylaria sp. CBS 124048]